MTSTFLDTVKLLKKADKAYYNTGKPVMTDMAYDRLRDKLAKDAPKIKDLKVRTKVKAYLGSTGVAETTGKKEKHPFYLPSLNKIKDDEPKGYKKYLDRFKRYYRLKDTPLQHVVGPKFDGSSVRHQYVDGAYVKSITRGDGLIGRDVTAHCRHLIKLGKMPAKIPLKGVVEIRSEICITKKDFAPWKGKKIDGYTYKEARNSANSYLVAKTVKKDFASCLTVVAFDCFDPDGNDLFPTKFRAIKAMAKWGFSDLYAKHATVWSEPGLKKGLDFMLDRFTSESFVIECDGVVVEANPRSIRVAMRVGYEDARPIRAMAYKHGKTTDKTAQITKVKRVFWTAAADGARVPNVEYDPIKVGNTTLTNALAHNAANVLDLGICLGVEVKVVRAGGVIPQVVEVTKRNKGLLRLPTKCDCGAKLDRIGPDLYCSAPDKCMYTQEAKFSRSCRFMDLDGLGTEGETKLFQKCGTIFKMLKLKEQVFQQVLGNAAGKRVFASITKWRKKASWLDMMVASGAFTRPGFSLAAKGLAKMLEVVAAKNIEITKLSAKDVKAALVKKGMTGAGTELFTAQWPEFIKFVNAI